MQVAAAAEQDLVSIQVQLPHWGVWVEVDKVEVDKEMLYLEQQTQVVAQGDQEIVDQLLMEGPV
ncbi:hypothetical protein EBS57_07795 [bacterium]|nr:hypothetical protein [bacterium]